MAKLHELAPAYYAAADRLTDKINELKLDVKEETDPMRRGRLESKLNNHLKECKSTMQAQRETGVRNSLISECCAGKRKTAGGYIWRYAT